MYESVLFQINTGHRRAAAYDLQLRTSQLDSFVCLIQEPWVVRGRPAGLDSQHNRIIANCGDKTNARAMIYSHRALPISEHAQFTGRDVACAVWEVGMPNLARVMLISLYWDGRYDQLPAKFLDCLKWCGEKSIPVHIGGDFNAHSTLWGSRTNSRRGDIVGQLIFDYNLVLLNEGDVATFNIGGRNGPEKSSIIDLTLTSPACFFFFFDVRVSFDTGLPLRALPTALGGGLLVILVYFIF